jgi:hypothetical protein
LARDAIFKDTASKGSWFKNPFGSIRTLLVQGLLNEKSPL